MTKKKLTIIFIIIFIISIGFFAYTKKTNYDDERFVSYTVNLKKQKVEFFWKNEKGENFKNFNNLKSWLNKNNKELIFATNGGMYKKDNSPQGLFIEKGKTKNKIDTTSGNGNFLP